MSVILIIYSLFTTICIGIVLVGLYQKNTNFICNSKRRLDGKTVLVTGGTSGMGLEIATDFAQRGAKVIVACPFEDEGKTGLESIIKNSGNRNVIFKLLDLSSFDSVKQFVENILENETRLDILVNNAGVLAGKHITKDGWNFILQINYLGTVLLTLLLLPLLKKTGTQQEPTRIVNTTSISHKIIKEIDFSIWKSTDNPVRHYQNSKLCIALFTRELAKRIDKYNVIVNVVDPGIVGTRIYELGTDKIRGIIIILLATFCSKTPWEGAQTAIHASLCYGSRKENGKYFNNGKVSTTIPTEAFFDDTKCKDLWEKTMTDLNFHKNL